jgi:hypothetical protein
MVRKKSTVESTTKTTKTTTHCRVFRQVPKTTLQYKGVVDVDVMQCWFAWNLHNRALPQAWKYGLIDMWATSTKYTLQSAIVAPTIQTPEDAFETK